MNLQRHHVLYILVVMSLMLALIVFFVPHTPNMSFTASSTASSTSAVASGTPAFRYEAVTSLADQELGLGGRSSIPSNYGMLFVFEERQRIGFWMKGMEVPIDIIWLSDTGSILGIEDSVSPGTYPQSFYPPEPVKYVLETRAGEARRQRWGIGTRIPLPAPYGLR